MNRGAAWRHLGGVQGTRAGSLHFPECKSFTEQGKTGEFSEYTFFVNFFFHSLCPKASFTPIFALCHFFREDRKTYLYAVPWRSRPLKSKEISCDSLGETHGVCSGWL